MMFLIGSLAAIYIFCNGLSVSGNGKEPNKTPEVPPEPPLTPEMRKVIDEVYEIAFQRMKDKKKKDRA